MALGISGGKVSVVPLMTMVADRSGRSCLMTLAMARPVRSWMQCATARAVNTMVRCASIGVAGAVEHRPGRRSVLDIRNERSTCHRSWYLRDHLAGGHHSAGTLVT